MSSFPDCPELFKILNSVQLSKILHECVDDLMGKNGFSFGNYKTDIECSSDQLDNARKVVQKIYREASIQNDLQVHKYNWDCPNIEMEIKNCYQLRKCDIFRALVKDNLINCGHTLVQIFNWKLRWVMGNSKLASVREALLQLEFVCANNEGVRVIAIELNLEQVDKFIAKLRQISNICIAQ